MKIKGPDVKGATIKQKKSIDTARDPYMNKAEPEDGSTCRKCGAVYRDKRWSLKAKAPAAEKEKVLCPACQKIKDKFAEGFVTLQGEFLKEHKEEILNLVRNKEERSMHTNPLHRIIEIKERNGKVEITTTTDKLAQRLGQVLKKTYSGEVEYKWSSDVKLARVVWTR